MFVAMRFILHFNQIIATSACPLSYPRYPLNVAIKSNHIDMLFFSPHTCLGNFYHAICCNSTTDVIPPEIYKIDIQPPFNTCFLDSPSPSYKIYLFYLPANKS